MSCALEGNALEFSFSFMRSAATDRTLDAIGIALARVVIGVGDALGVNVHREAATIHLSNR